MTSVAHKVALAQGITCHSWNKDKTMVALCPNSNVVLVYKVDDIKSPNCKWELAHELKEHDQVVTGIDWAPNTNRILTASQDRNAYVWNYEEADGKGVWKPTLVILRVNRAATCVKWTADETKFAVGSGARCVPVCHYDSEHNWWVSKIIKKHKSTILSLDWHPTSPLLATGSSDFKCRVFSAFIKNVDSKESAKANPWDSGDGKMGFGDVLQEWTCSGWVHCVRWSPSGSTLAFAGHDSSASFVTVRGANSTLQTIKLSSLPFRSLLFLSDSACAAAGFELNPQVFVSTTGEWIQKGALDKKDDNKQADKQAGAKAAFAVFQNQAKKGAANSTESDDLPTKHQNSISAMSVVSTSGGSVNHFTSTGLDGIVVSWDLGSGLEDALAKLAL